MARPAVLAAVAVLALALTGCGADDGTQAAAGATVSTADVLSTDGAPEHADATGAVSSDAPPPVTMTVTTSTPPSTATTSAPPVNTVPEGVTGLLDRVVVAAVPTDLPDYERDRFGGDWADVDGDCQDTRQEVLIAESLAPVVLEPGACRVASGAWESAYDLATWEDPAELQIDHLVPLAEAWRSGASTWAPERLVAYANDLSDPGHLQAVTGDVNSAKGDANPERWRPPAPDAWCAYAVEWLTVKARWELTVTAGELAALRSMLLTCRSDAVAPSIPPVVVTTEAPPATVVPSTGTAGPPPSGACDPSYPDVCIPPAPPDLDCGEVAVRRFVVVGDDPHGFDSDHDGMGCES